MKDQNEAGFRGIYIYIFRRRVSDHLNKISDSSRTAVDICKTVK